MQWHIKRGNLNTRNSFRYILSPAQSIFWCSFTLPTLSLLQCFLWGRALIVQGFLVCKMLFSTCSQTSAVLNLTLYVPFVALEILCTLVSWNPTASQHWYPSFFVVPFGWHVNFIVDLLLLGVCQIREVISHDISPISLVFALFSLFQCRSWSNTIRYSYQCKAI